MAAYAILTLAKKGPFTGDQVAELLLDTQKSAGWGCRMRLVPRSDTGVYDEALRRVERACAKRRAYFRIVDGADALVEITIPPKRRQPAKRLLRFVRVARYDGPLVLPPHVTDLSIRGHA
jgi:hypothetical protein